MVNKSRTSRRTTQRRTPRRDPRTGRFVARPKARRRTTTKRTVRRTASRRPRRRMRVRQPGGRYAVIVGRQRRAERLRTTLDARPKDVEVEFPDLGPDSSKGPDALETEQRPVLAAQVPPQG